MNGSRASLPYRMPSLGSSGRLSWLTGPVAASVTGILALAAVLTTWEAIPVVGRLAPPETLRWALLGVVVVFLGSMLWRERLHRALVAQLGDERVLAAAYSNRVRDLSALVSTARTINGALELEDVLKALLDEAMGFFQGEAGSIMLLDGSGFLETAATRGNESAAQARIRIGDSIAGHVALTREPLLLSGKPSPRRFRHLVERSEPVSSAMCVPLIHRNELLGVLNVNALSGREFGDHDLQLLTVFAGHAAIGIANARVFQTERARLSQLSDLNDTKSELIAGISSELRAPLTALSGGLGALQRMTVHDPDASDILAGMQHHLDRLGASVGRLLSESEIARSQAGPTLMGVVDLQEVAATVAEDFSSDGRSVDVGVSDELRVAGDPALLQQALWNLLDNAFKYGSPPVSIAVQRQDDHGLISVTDRGKGIAPGDRERIFDRSRLAGHGKKAMGLGLSIVHGIVSSCGGRIWADDAEGGGTVFTIALPLADDTGSRPQEVRAS